MNPCNSAARTITISQPAVPDKLDYILSSVRPFSQDSDYAKLQEQAIISWAPIARNIVFFNLRGDLSGIAQANGITLVGPESDPPSIKQMLLWLSTKHPDASAAIVNSDIILTPDAGKIPAMALQNSLGRAWACTSFRRSLDTKTGVISKPEDYGLDFFCATIRIWNDVALKVPGVLTIGRPVWDNWLNGFLKLYIDKSKYIDITDWRCVIHPKHENHFRLGNVTGPVELPAAHGLPTRKLPIPR